MKPNPELPQSVDYSPEKLLAPFARGQIALWMAVAIGVHLLLIGGTSLGFIRDRWIDPEGAAIRKAQAEALVAAAAAKKAPPKPETKPVAATATNVPATAPKPVEQTTLEQRKDTPVVKRITEAAPTNTIPKGPEDIGISLRDTDMK